MIINCGLNKDKHFYIDYSKKKGYPSTLHTIGIGLMSHNYITDFIVYLYDDSDIYYFRFIM